MNRPDDFDDVDLDLQQRLEGLLAHEPPMASVPADDLHRGQRLVRRRRWGTAGTAAVLFPAMAVGTVLATNALVAGWAGDEGGQLVPAGDPTGGAASDATCDPGTLVLPGGGTPDFSEQTPGTEPGQSQVQGSNDAQGSNSGAATAQEGKSVRPGKTGSGDATAYYVCSDTTDSMDRLDRLLGDTLDPNGDHTGGSSIGASSGSVSADTGEPGQGDGQSFMVGRDWADGDRTGMIWLSLLSGGNLALPGSCADLSMGGPEVTCEQTTLPDGTEVSVGHGRQGGAERLTVAYERPDGTVVIATADEATSERWEEGTGSDPLTDLPVTVDQLAELATAPGAHF